MATSLPKSMQDILKRDEIYTNRVELGVVFGSTNPMEIPISYLPQYETPTANILSFKTKPIVDGILGSSGSKPLFDFAQQRNIYCPSKAMVCQRESQSAIQWWVMALVFVTAALTIANGVSVGAVILSMGVVGAATYGIGSAMKPTCDKHSRTYQTTCDPAKIKCPASDGSCTAPSATGNQICQQWDTKSNQSKICGDDEKGCCKKIKAKLT